MVSFISLDIYLFLGNDPPPSILVTLIWSFRRCGAIFWERAISQRQRVGLASRILQSSDCRTWTAGSINSPPTEWWETSTFGTFEHASLPLVSLVFFRYLALFQLFLFGFCTNNSLNYSKIHFLAQLVLFTNTCFLRNLAIFAELE